MGDTESQDVKVEKKRGGKILLVLVAAVLVLGAAAAGVLLVPKFFGSNEAAAAPAASSADSPVDKGPNETMTLAPIVIDSQGREGDAHHVKVVIAIELAEGMTEADFKRFVPRCREAAVAYLRSQLFEELTNPKRFGAVQKDLSKVLLDAIGPGRATRVLVTDFVAQ